MRIIRYFIAFVIVVIASCADREQMLRQLEQAEQQNRDYVPFTSDSLALSLTDYFDSHGTANERMRAHYILGCAYRDLGEAPRALECYNDAVECADTTAKDCDFKTMSRVYGQATDIFTDQYLLDEAMKSSIKSYNYAILSKDTLAAIINIERRALIYSLENKEDSAFYYRKKATSSYLSIGDIQGYAESHYSLLLSYLNYNDYVNAKKSINIYESMSGLFNDSGHIVKGKELYYYEKGLYFLGVNILDTAEIYFRRTLEHSDNHNLEEAGNYGLYLLYNKKHMPDSAAKYAALAYETNNRRDLEKSSAELQRSQLNYNYQRNARIARDEKIKNQKYIMAFLVLCIIVLIVIAVSTICLIIVSNKRKKEKNIYKERIKLLVHKQNEVLLLNERNYKDLIGKKTNEIQTLSLLVQEYHKRTIKSISASEDRLFSSNIVKVLHNKASRAKELPTEEEWEQFSILINNTIPSFYTKMNGGHAELSTKEYYICMLVRANFSPFEICNLLEVSSSNLSMMRVRLMKKVFGISGKAKEFDKKVRQIV